MALDNQCDMDVGIDGIAVKPSETAISMVGSVPVDLVTVDFEGHANFPSVQRLRELAETKTVRVTIPVRADGFDPLGDHQVFSRLRGVTEFVFVAGHPAYLSGTEVSRAIAPRLEKACSMVENEWVGTEGIQHLTRDLAVPRYAVLSPDTASWVKAVRGNGFGGLVAVYAPTVITTDRAVALESVGAYVARRAPVRKRLSGDSFDHVGASEEAKAIVSAAIDKYALVGDLSHIQFRIKALKEVGVDRIIAYPARSVQSLFSTEF